MAAHLPELVQQACHRITEVATDWLDAMKRDPRIQQPEFPYQRTSSDHIIVKNLGHVALHESNHDS